MDPPSTAPKSPMLLKWLDDSLTFNPEIVFPSPSKLPLNLFFTALDKSDLFWYHPIGFQLPLLILMFPRSMDCVRRKYFPSKLFPAATISESPIRSARLEISYGADSVPSPLHVVFPFQFVQRSPVELLNNATPYGSVSSYALRTASSCSENQERNAAASSSGFSSSASTNFITQFQRSALSLCAKNHVVNSSVPISGMESKISSVTAAFVPGFVSLFSVSAGAGLLAVAFSLITTAFFSVSASLAASAIGVSFPSSVFSTFWVFSPSAFSAFPVLLSTFAFVSGVSAIAAVDTRRFCATIATARADTR